MSAHRVYARPGSQAGSGLFVGSFPPPTLRADTLVLCARELQVGSEHWPRVRAVLRVPLNDDGSPMHPLEIQGALEMSKIVERRVRAGESVIVTCAQGRNRSGLVAALALVRLGFTGLGAIAQVRSARPRNALTNERFVRLILDCAAANRWQPVAPHRSVG